MVSRSVRTISVALALSVAAISASPGSASAKPMFPNGPAKFGMPKKFVKPHGPYGKWGYGGGWGPGIGLGFGVAALGLAAAARAADDCYVKRVVSVYGDVFYRRVCY